MRGAATVAACLWIATAAAGGGEVRVEPSVGVVPANHLKFYLHFPGPMERGEVFRHLRLVETDEDGEETAEVPEPFREVELWDETFTRLTLWFHPGRQKPGVNLNVEIGPVLEEGKRYRLEISGKWRDEQGEPLGETVRHGFAAGPVDERQPQPAEWRVVFTGGFVRVETGEPLDPESLRKRVTVVDGEGGSLAAEIEPDATGFRLAPDQPWRPGSYRLLVDPRLEDLAGNSVARPFNVDLEKGTGESSEEAVAIPFEIEDSGRE